MRFRLAQLNLILAEIRELMEGTYISVCFRTALPPVLPGTLLV